MIFQVERTSGFYNNSDEPPCRGCIPIKLTDTFIDEYDSWGIEINSLEELINLVKETDEPLIIYYVFGSNYKFHIEIYDDYRE